jgi:hypothetical protein
MQSCFCDSSQSILSENYRRTLLSNKAECDECKSLIYQKQNRRCSMCGDCVEKLYSPKICTVCNGRISFQDLKNTNIKHHHESFGKDETKIKLCNCFPKYPSQNFNSIQPPVEHLQILPNFSESCSYNEIYHQPTKGKKTLFSSHNCIPLKTSSSDVDDDSDSEEEIK